MKEEKATVAVITVPLFMCCFLIDWLIIFIIMLYQVMACSLAPKASPDLCVWYVWLCYGEKQAVPPTQTVLYCRGKKNDLNLLYTAECSLLKDNKPLKKQNMLWFPWISSLFLVTSLGQLFINHLWQQHVTSSPFSYPPPLQHFILSLWCHTAFYKQRTFSFVWFPEVNFSWLPNKNISIVLHNIDDPAPSICDYLCSSQW